MVSGPGLAPEWALYAQQLLDIYNEFPDLPRSQVDGRLAREHGRMLRCDLWPRYAQLPRVPSWRMAWPHLLVVNVEIGVEGDRVHARSLRLRAAQCRLLLAQAAGAAARALPSDVITLVARHLPAAVWRSYLMLERQALELLDREFGKQRRKRRRQ